MRLLSKPRAVEHLIRSYGSGVGGHPMFTTACTCGARIESLDADQHNDFTLRHSLEHDTRHVGSDEWSLWITVAQRQGAPL